MRVHISVHMHMWSTFWGWVHIDLVVVVIWYNDPSPFASPMQAPWWWLLYDTTTHHPLHLPCQAGYAQPWWGDVHAVYTIKTKPEFNVVLPHGQISMPNWRQNIMCLDVWIILSPLRCGFQCWSWCQNFDVNSTSGKLMLKWHLNNLLQCIG